MYCLSFRSTIGWITLTGSEKALLTVQFGKHGTDNPHTLLKKCKTEINEYLAGKRQLFTVSLRASGTPFNQKVLRAVQKIPYGSTATYGEIAQSIRHATAYRAVANACGRNALPILLPCHRVVAQNGIGGYNGGVGKKQVLLHLEKKTSTVSGH